MWSDPLRGLLVAALAALAPAQDPRLSDRATPLQTDHVPARTAPLELGDPFLGLGPISPGFTLPTGATWNPELQVFGTLRTALQGIYDGRTYTSEWANRLDVFGNLRLTPTERVLVGFRPLDDEGREFTSWQITPEQDDGFRSAFDGRVSALFFEGDFGELFPGLDPGDGHALDWGFAVGRQPLRFQEGMLLDDTIDALGVVRNNLDWFGTSNLRITGLWGWGRVERGDGARDDATDLLGLFLEADRGETTIALDLAQVFAPSDTGDAFFAGASAVRRVGALNLSVRGNVALPQEGETAATGRGGLLFGEVSHTLRGTEDLVYTNAYWGIEDFSSAARSPDAGGPLARVGILYAAQGVGRYGSALSSDPRRSVGAALGWQGFFADHTRQLIVELGGRADTNGADAAAAALGARYQHGLGARVLVQLDAFGSLQEATDPGFGTRLEVLVKL